MPFPVCFLDGKILFLEEARLQVTERGFTYGDGLFETIKVCRSKLVRWGAHSRRFSHGAELLKMSVPWALKELEGIVDELGRQNGMADGLARIQLSRGPGERGYLPGGAKPTMVITMHPPCAGWDGESGWSVVTSSIPLFSRDPLAGVKSCNKLHQVMARLEAAEQGADDAVFLNESGEVVETTACNLFWIEDGTICTPPLGSGALPGITREAVLKLASELKHPIEERPASLHHVKASQGVFLSSTGVGLMPVARWDGIALPMGPSGKRACRLLDDSLKEMD